MGLPDKLNMIIGCNIDGTYEKRDFTWGGDNVETAGNIILPVYCLPSGEPTDFLAYRYHNNYYNGGTLVHLGEVGESLLKGDKAGDVLLGCLRLCAEKYPGEQTAEWYECLIGVQRKVSEYGKTFVAAFYEARDGMTAAFYAGEKEAYSGMGKRMSELTEGLEAVIREKQALDKLLVEGTDMAGQDQRRKALLGRIEEEERKCVEALADVSGLRISIKKPKKVNVQHALGGIQVEAGITFIGLYGLRADMLQTMKELGCNVWTFQWANGFFPFMDSPLAKSLMKGVRIQRRTGSFKEVRIEQGRLDVLTGQVEETPRETRQPEKLEENIKKLTETWKSFPMIRYWGGLEAGLRNNYWGEQAREEYVAHLKEKYGEIGKLNERWLTAHTNFDEIKLITRQPAKESEHANWEDWRKFRELQLFKSYDAGYRLFKKYMPTNTFYSSCISIGRRSDVMAGVDYYELTKAQDISGMDGTDTPINIEWTYLDLIAGDRKMWTMEWGGFYNPPADILKGLKKLRRQLWREVSGGHIGINCWIWRWPGYRANCVDTTGLPTQYGWELKQLVSDFRKIEHILLDGKRVDPEVRILFSNTTRSHDQVWMAWKTWDAFLHMTAVDNLYGRFMKLHLAARVLDEGALKDGADLSKCRLLFVPHAQYLSCEIQDKLLNYARNGGCLVIEGLSGKYDNYGNSANNIFKALGVVPGMVETKEVQLLPGIFRGIRDKKYQEQSYAPVAVEYGKPIIDYKSGEPAVISMGLGKGKVIVSGMPFSVMEPKSSELFIKELFKEVEFIPKYQCNDEALVLREWEYDGGLYLVCAYSEGKDLVNQFEMKVRGNWEVEDYMIGAKVPVEQGEVYTKFKGLILSPGGCVYRLKPAKEQPSKAIIDRVKTNQTNQPAKSDDKNKVRQTSQPKTLPYKGDIQQIDDEIEMGGYNFSIAVVVEEYFKEGRVFLTVRRGDEERQQELKVREDALFVFGDEALKVKCEAHSYNYPEGATVEIEKVARPKLDSVCMITTNGAARELSNGMVSFKFLPDERGGKITELRTYPEGINHVADEGIFMQKWYSPFDHFTIKREEVLPQKCGFILGPEKMLPEVKELEEISLEKGVACVNINFELRNDCDKIWSGWLSVSENLNVGGMADNDMFYVPEKEGIETIQFIADGGNYVFYPASGWTACCDTRERLVYVSKFNLDEIKTLNLCFNTDFYNMEPLSILNTKKVNKLKKGESLRLNHGIYIIRGLSGVGGFARGWAGNMIIPAAKWSQDKKMKIKLEIGNAYLKKQSVWVRVALRRAGKDVRVYYDDKANVSYEDGLEQEIEAGFDGLAEGDYELEARIGTDAAEILTIRKKMILFGKKLEDNRAACKVYKELLNAYKRQKVTSDQKFNAVQVLEELKAAVERQDAEVIRQKKEALERMLDAAK